jgi:RND family efflux transporter MFP subunit
MKMLCKKTFFIVTLTALFLLPTTPLWAEPVEFDGLIEPYEVINIGAPTVGIVSRVTVDRGSLVEKGQVLVELESSLERATLEKAKAMATFDGEIGMSQTQLAFANRVHERVKPLAAISTHDKDQAATEILLTQYRLEKARENLTLAKLELKRTEAALALRSIKSPIPGVVVERYVSPGEYANSQPLLRVAQIDPLRVEVILPAQVFGKIKPGMRATIVPELPEYGEHTAKVTIVDKVIDSASSTFGVRLEMPNEKQKMPSGLKCVVKFDIEEIGGGVKTTANRIPSGR